MAVFITQDAKQTFLQQSVEENNINSVYNKKRI